MAKIRGGRKHAFPNKKEYQRHLREMVKQGKASGADGNWGMVANPGMHDFLVSGYKLR